MTPRLGIALTAVAFLGLAAACGDDIGTASGSGSSSSTSSSSSGAETCNRVIPFADLEPAAGGSTGRRFGVEGDDDLEALRDVRHIEGGLLITNTTATDLSPLSCLERVDGWLSIISNPNLESLNGLENLAAAELLLVSSNARLESLEAFGPVPVLRDGIIISENESLRRLGLNHLEEVSSFVSFGLCECQPDSTCQGLGGNPLLTEIDGFESLTYMFSLTVAGQPGLTSLAHLRSRVEQGMVLDEVDFKENPNLPRSEVDELAEAAGATNTQSCGNLGEEPCECFFGPD